MSTINFKIDYNSVRTTNPEMGSEVLARKSRYILENKLVFDDPVILRVVLYARLSVEDGDDEISDSIATQLAIGAGFFALNPELIHVKTYIDDGYKAWIKLLREFQKTAELTAEIMDAFVERVTVRKEQHILVEYSF